VSPADPFELAVRIGEMLDSLGIRYVIGGSVASMLYGEPRMTLDLDVMIDADERSVLEIVQRLTHDFYVEADDALQAVRHRSSFNAIRFDDLMKVDFFVPERRPEVTLQFERARVVSLASGTASFYAPEDILVRKLIWFRMGGEHSERQWRDILGILRFVQQPLDDAYLERAAASFAVADLLARAREDAASP
jgi:hypothetical protein